MRIFSQLHATSTLKMSIFLPTVILVTAITLFCSLFPTLAQQTFDLAKQAVFHHFSWFYIFAGSVFFLFLTFLCLSRLGDIRRFIYNIARPAFEELAAEFQSYQLTARLNLIEGKNPKIEFEVQKENLRNFLYGIECQSRALSDLVVEDEQIPHIETNKLYEPITYFFDGRQGYNVQYMTKEELIADVLKQYERFMNLAMDDSHALMTADVENLN